MDIQGYSPRKRLCWPFTIDQLLVTVVMCLDPRQYKFLKYPFIFLNLKKRFCHEIPHSPDSPKHYWNADMKCDKAKTCVGAAEVFGHA